MYTRHGHHIEGTTLDGDAPSVVISCSGAPVCPQCASDVGNVKFVPAKTPDLGEALKNVIKNALGWAMYGDKDRIVVEVDDDQLAKIHEFGDHIFKQVDEYLMAIKPPEEGK